ncbi:hypothetical protein EDD94_0911 [Streptomyces sp. PanSC9]|nr:hypothetical protein EDD94_0911 [Streptomyces sp. PanSC9]
MLTGPPPKDAATARPRPVNRPGECAGRLAHSLAGHPRPSAHHSDGPTPLPLDPTPRKARP